ncbi:MAG TPA: family 16 glycoside hydrolase [Saprospiraceae bacterium]|nr:family 16 glycoside hydrolase [Saprospiraceae bacterium]
MKTLLCPFLFLFSIQMSIAQASKVKIDMVESNWQVPEDATFEQFDHRNTLVLNSGRATLKNLDFTNGTIEVDVFAHAKRSFAGITFRKQAENMEEVYMRMHKSSQVDAVQYTPIFNNESNWQLFREYQARVVLKDTGWNTLRLEVYGREAEVFVNDEKVMSIDYLRTEQDAGEIGLFALFSNRFSNFRVSRRDSIKEPLSVDQKPVESSIIRQWAITGASLYREEEIDFEGFSKETYRKVETEASGLLPVSKYLKKPSAGNFEQNTEVFTVASTTVYASKEEIRLFSFDYSDKIMVYLNGQLIFKGNNAFRAKGVQYMGHMDINTNTLYLSLNQGVNKIHCVLIDQANGWGIMGKLK